MKNTVKIGKRLSLTLVLGLAVGLLVSFGCGDDNGGVAATTNNPPVLDEIGDRTVDLGSTLSFTVTAADPDGDVLSFSVTDLPSGATFDGTTQEFSWTPIPGVDRATTYRVTFTVYDKGFSDSDTVTITVNPVPATGANYTGIYITMASNFAGSCEVTCEQQALLMQVTGPPSPACPMLILLLIQSDDRIAAADLNRDEGLGIEGSILNDGSFTASGSFQVGVAGPLTMYVTVAGEISPDKSGGSFYIEFVDAVTSCDWGFNSTGPPPAHNATVTVSGFDSNFNENIYALIIGENIGAVGGSKLNNGAASIQLTPELPDGVYKITVLIDVDGNIIETLKNSGMPLSGGDLWIGGEATITIEGGSGTLALIAEDFIQFIP